MKRMILALAVLTLGMLLVSSCNEASPIGAELVEGDQANIKYTDSVSFNALTVKEDSVLVFDPNPSIEFNNFFVGDYDDPVFGNTKADLNAQLWPSSIPVFINTDAVLDSIVLILRYDSNDTYGDLVTDPYRLGVFRLTENIDLERNYYSNDEFQYDMANPLAKTGDFIPKYSSADTVRVVDYTFSTADTITLPAHLRIHLPEEFGNELLNLDSSIYASTSAFLNHFNGIVVKGLKRTKGILNFDLKSDISNMTLYFHTDTIYQQYKFAFHSNAVKFSNFKHDYTGSIVDDFFNNKTKGDSLVFIQAMSGPNIQIEFPDPEKLGDIIVNKAELIFTYAELEEDNIKIYPPLERTIIAIDDEVTGAFGFINDVIVGSQSGTNWFGGVVEEKIDNGGEKIFTYTYNISSHFQRIIDGTAGNIIFIRAFPKQSKAERSILYGPKHSKYPVKFNLTYTVLNP
jgi:predicted small secreted protein